jgi:hypothetical protein
MTPSPQPKLSSLSVFLLFVQTSIILGNLTFEDLFSGHVERRGEWMTPMWYPQLFKKEKEEEVLRDWIV